MLAADSCSVGYAAIVPPFYIYPRLLSLALDVVGCLEADSRAKRLSRSQFLFEVDFLRVLLTHRSRVHARGQAEVFVLPLLAMASKQAGRCRSTTHPERRLQMLTALTTEVDFRAGPHLLACTCVMLPSLFGQPLFGLLSNWSSRIVQLTQAPRTWSKGSTGPSQAVVPYHTPAEFTADDCEAARPSLAAFFGSIDTKDPNSTLVRRHIAHVASASGGHVLFRATERRGTAGSSCASRGACVDGVNAGHGSERLVPAKPAMAAAMRNASVCLVPEGDSPETSRLYDAIQALCLPVIITDRLLVPPSSSWASATIVVSPREFLSMSAATVLEKLKHEAFSSGRRRRCAALRTLRRDLLPDCVVPRVVRAARQLVSAAEAEGSTLEDRTMSVRLPFQNALAKDGLAPPHTLLFSSSQGHSHRCVLGLCAVALPTRRTSAHFA